MSIEKNLIDLIKATNIVDATKVVTEITNSNAVPEAINGIKSSNISIDGLLFLSNKLTYLSKSSNDNDLISNIDKLTEAIQYSIQKEQPSAQTDLVRLNNIQSNLQQHINDNQQEIKLNNAYQGLADYLTYLVISEKNINNRINKIAELVNDIMKCIEIAFINNSIKPDSPSLNINDEKLNVLVCNFLNTVHSCKSILYKNYLAARETVKATIKKEKKSQPELCQHAHTTVVFSDYILNNNIGSVKMKKLTKILTKTNETLKSPTHKKVNHKVCVAAMLLSGALVGAGTAGLGGMNLPGVIAGAITGALLMALRYYMFYRMAAKRQRKKDIKQHRELNQNLWANKLANPIFSTNIQGNSPNEIASDHKLRVST